MARMMRRDVVGTNIRTEGARVYSAPSGRPRELVGPGEGRIQCEFCGAYRTPLEGTTDVLRRHKQSDGSTPCLRSLARLEDHQESLRPAREERQKERRRARSELARKQELRRLLGQE